MTDPPFFREFREEFKYWVPRMRSKPEALVHEFGLALPFEKHDVYMFRLENRMYAVVNVCTSDADEYDPRDDTIVLLPGYREAFRAFRRFVEKELREETPPL